MFQHWQRWTDSQNAFSRRITRKLAIQAIKTASAISPGKCCYTTLW